MEAHLHDLLQRFLRYVAIDTQAKSGVQSVPSSSGQFELARLLVKELHQLGLQAEMNEHAYVTACLPAKNADPHAPTIGLLAHLDTALEASGKVRPCVIENYQGSSIELQPGMYLTPEAFPSLLNQIGKTLVVTDGTSLLGADDKAGIAEIMTVLSQLQSNPSYSHPTLKIAFVPDEEIGHGASLLDLDAFKADFAYTLDGSGLGVIEYENFNAASATIHIQGLAIHPGYAKNHMVNAILLAQEFLNDLPENEHPSVTEGMEGFFHVTNIHGEVSQAQIDIIIRDHDTVHFNKRKALVKSLVDNLNKRYPVSEGSSPRVSLNLHDQYKNMLKYIEPHCHIVNTALEAMKACGLSPQNRAIRGGTDGAQLSLRGLPTPNLFSGGYNAHGPYEYVALEDMEASVNVILTILASYAYRNI